MPTALPFRRRRDRLSGEAEQVIVEIDGSVEVLNNRAETSGADDDVMDAAGDLRGREVDRLLGRAALEVDCRCGGLDREPLLEPSVAADVQTLRTELGDAARDHILDLASVDALGCPRSYARADLLLARTAFNHRDRCRRYHEQRARA